MRSLPIDSLLCNLHQLIKVVLAIKTEKSKIPLDKCPTEDDWTIRLTCRTLKECRARYNERVV